MPIETWDRVWTNASLATMVEGGAAYGIEHKAALAVAGGRIAWVGRMADLPDSAERCALDVHDVGGAWITPGLIDCHTHLVYAGNRAHEFEQRLQGASYEDIARSGGGILSTVDAVRRASEQDLVDQSLTRLDTLLAEGVTTIEIKSGYGLDTQTEVKMLHAARALARVRPVDIVTTFLGAHALPEEFQNRPDSYLDRLCDEMLPEVRAQSLANTVDAFCEGIGFSNQQVGRVFSKASELGMRVKLHADQLSDRNGAALAAKYGALSADHLEYTNEAGVAAMAAAGTTAVLLPGAFYFLGETRRPPVHWFREYGVAIAVATDCNPGSSPTTSLLLMLNMACTLFRMTPDEALAGVTRHAARALGLGDRGTLERGKRADLAIWSIAHPAELAYHIGANPCRAVIRAGEIVKTVEVV